MYLSIYLTPEQQRLVANSLHFSLSIARYQASQRPMPSRSLLSCSAQVVLGRPRGRFHPGPSAITASPYCSPKRIVGENTGLNLIRCRYIKILTRLQKIQIQSSDGTCEICSSAPLTSILLPSKSEKLWFCALQIIARNGVVQQYC